MCGRYAFSSIEAPLAERFRRADSPRIEARYNVAPTQQAAVIRRFASGASSSESDPAPCAESRDEASAVPGLDLLRWGLIPRWAGDVAMGARLINARSETAGEKPAFREALRLRRCLVPADGFYEWRKRSGGKEAHYVSLVSGGPFAMAGLWESWRGPAAERIDSFTILTTEANEALRGLHHRMPVILREEAWEDWLGPGALEPALLAELFRPYPGGELRHWAVSPRVNRPQNDDADLVRQVVPPDLFETRETR